MIKVYIASPYSIGDQADNVRKQMDSFDQLVKAGFAPYAPLLSHFQQIVHPLPYSTWIALDFEWVRACDCLLRLEGESRGADMEVTIARNAGKRVFYDINDLKFYYETTENKE
jgi:hypothetical protein